MNNNATVTLTIDGKNINAIAGTTILVAARSAEVYIPTLCSHPDLPPAEFEISSKKIFQGRSQIDNTKPGKTAMKCGMCIVEVHQGKEKMLINSCVTRVNEGMIVITDSDIVREERRKNLSPILYRHRHSCLVCAQQEGCSQTQCSSNVPENERCCSQFDTCELRSVINYVGIPDDRPKWHHKEFPVIENEPLLKTDYNLCIGCTRCVRVCNKIRGVGAISFVWDTQNSLQVGTVAETLAKSGCKFCTACVEVCPTGSLQDKIIKSGKKSDYLVPCKSACPANVDVPEYLRMISSGNFDVANAIIREKVPLPATLGRICMHPCEDACRRKEINGSVSICALKRFASNTNFNDLFRKKGLNKTCLKTGKKVAIVGAGPAGLTASFYLSKKGHHVTLYEERSKAGGMLRYGIPDYRLPIDILDEEINTIMSMGVEFVPNSKFGLDFDLESLQNNKYDAIMIAIGMQNDRKIPLKGLDLRGVVGSMKFLRQAARSGEMKVGRNVVVIGGGNVAVDVAMTSIRCGAESVCMVCLESEQEMPASSWEIETAKAEGIKIMPSWSPMEIIGKNGSVVGLNIVQCQYVFDENGDFNPKCNWSVKKSISADQILMAIGQETDVSIFSHSNILTEKGIITVDINTLETTLPNIYAAGDAASRKSGSVILAIASGRKVAESIDSALGGTGIIDETLVDRIPSDGNIGIDYDFVHLPRGKETQIAPKERRDNFKEIAIDFSNKQAIHEASRCLQCDLRLSINNNPLPQSQRLLVLTREEIDVVIPYETEGVYKLLDENKVVSSISGTPNLRSDLIDAFEKNNTNAVFFEFEENKMYSKRESELIQEHLQRYGEMPKEDNDMDDLF